MTLDTQRLNSRRHNSDPRLIELNSIVGETQSIADRLKRLSNKAFLSEELPDQVAKLLSEAKIKVEQAEQYAMRAERDLRETLEKVS